MKKIFGLILTLLIVALLLSCQTTEERKKEEGWHGPGATIEQSEKEGTNAGTRQGDGATVEALRYNTSF